MRTHALAARSLTRPAAQRPVILCLLLMVLAWGAPAAAQSFLGTIRGTVVDPQGSAVSGAAVLIVDEATGVPRTLDTDGEGRYEAANLRPGNYRVEVVTANFKKAERTGVLVRAAGTALVDVNLEIGNINETVTVSGDAINNITLDSQAIARGLDEQQIRDLPRDTRDIQSFLLLNHPQFFPTYGSGFVDLTTYLIDGDPNNGSTGVLGADSIGNTEGFSPGRVFRIGIRARF